ncbi:unnamed protein product [Bursaphelenchus okinawaensis]|uniref:Carbohydrate sulfotransferase n=1 Tax=Bursaphelenchus okinawaensis TaxID=465554 RepID=A0A811L955_9BILA|nr:unnamed protein product [Bursaphelenchus okinawaensis]CAG9118475.1 unnamed protein product [Bursaphelenchus okinawaensis]
MLAYNKLLEAEDGAITEDIVYSGSLDNNVVVDGREVMFGSQTFACSVDSVSSRITEDYKCYNVTSESSTSFSYKDSSFLSDDSGFPSKDSEFPSEDSENSENPITSKLPTILLISTIAVLAVKLNTLSHSVKYFDSKQIQHVVDDMKNHELKTKNDWTGYCIANPGACAQLYMPMNEAFVRKIVIARDYKTLNCILPKCMSTITTMVYSYLTDPVRYKRFKWNNSRGVSATHHKNDFDSLQTFQHNEHVSDKDLEKWSMNVAIRDPMDRFISAWLNKCVEERLLLSRDNILYGGGELCYGCGEDFECFLRAQYKRAILYSKGAMTTVSYEDQHTFPQNWFCDFRNHLHRYNVIKHTTDYEGKAAFYTWMRNLMERQKVPKEKIKFVFKHILTPLDGRKTKAKDKKHNMLKYKADEARERLLSDKDMYNIFMAMFVYDYVLFDYEIPKRTSDEP